jgi:DNA adenine methylase
MKTPISYYGGKQRMLPHILPLVPEHGIYTEAFCGGAAVYWAKEPAAIEVINDMNGEVVNFYRVLRTEFEALKELVDDTMHSRRSYYDALVMYERPHLFDELDRAWAFWMLTCQGFSSKPESWGYDVSGTTTKKMVNAQGRFGPELAMRLQRTQIECNDALKVIASRDRIETFHYVDPPYFNSDCGHYKGYSGQDFEALLKLLANVKGKFLLSSYPSELLEKYTKEMGWKQQLVQQTVAVSKRVTPKLKVECLTYNY